MVGWARAGSAGAPEAPFLSAVALHSAQSQVDDLQQAVAFFKSGDEELETEFQLPTPADEENPVHQQQKELTRMARAVAGGAAAVDLLPDDEEDWQEY